MRSVAEMRPGIHIELVDEPDFFTPFESGARLQGSNVERSRSLWPTHFSNAAFLYEDPSEPGDPRLVRSWAEFESAKGDISDRSCLPAAVHGFFINGGAACHLVPVRERGVSGRFEHLHDLDDVGLLCYPDLVHECVTADGSSPDPEIFAAVQAELIAHCDAIGDRVAILDAPPGMSPADVSEWRRDVAGHDSAAAALYYPWIRVVNGSEAAVDAPATILIPPCGHVAGTLARLDATRGVAKDPGDMLLWGVIDLARRLDPNDRARLNPIGVNCIVAAASRGIRVWGDRTLSSDALRRLLATTRVLNAIFRGIRHGTSWAVHSASSDESLQAQLVHDVREFLDALWRSRVLSGATRDDAYAVWGDGGAAAAPDRQSGVMVLEGFATVAQSTFGFRVSYARDSDA